MVVFISEVLLARGATDVGPPRALDEAVAEAYEPRLRCCCCCCCCFDDDLPLLTSLDDDDEDEASTESDSLPLEEEPLSPPPLDDDDDRGMLVVAPASLRILLMLPVFILDRLDRWND